MARTANTPPISLPPPLPLLHLLQGLSEAHDLGTGIGLAIALVASYYMAGMVVMIHDERIIFLVPPYRPRLSNRLLYVCSSPYRSGYWGVSLDRG